MNNNDDPDAFLRRFERMTNPPEVSRPFRILQERIKEKSKLPAIAPKPQGGMKSRDKAVFEMDEM